MDNLGIPLDSKVIHIDSEVIRATCNLRDASASKKGNQISSFNTADYMNYECYKGKEVHSRNVGQVSLCQTLH